MGNNTNSKNFDWFYDTPVNKLINIDYVIAKLMRKLLPKVWSHSNYSIRDFGTDTLIGTVLTRKIGKVPDGVAYFQFYMFPLDVSKKMKSNCEGNVNYVFLVPAGAYSKKEIKAAVDTGATIVRVSENKTTTNYAAKSLIASENSWTETSVLCKMPSTREHLEGYQKFNEAQKKVDYLQAALQKCKEDNKRLSRPLRRLAALADTFGIEEYTDDIVERLVDRAAERKINRYAFFSTANSFYGK